MKYQDALLAMKATRPVLLEQWGKAEAIGRKSESIIDSVTATDIAVEQAVSAALAARYPDISFVGEESGGDRAASRFWLMDPIDGTAHFMRGLPFCTSMLALIEDGKVTLGAVYDFLNDRMYFAESGEGAFCDEERLQVSNRALKDSYTDWEIRLKPENELIINTLRPKTVLVKTISAGWSFAMVAAGKLDARICYDPYGKDYDFAPGALLVKEAGGMVANIGSREYDYRNTSFLATNPVVFKELTEGPDAIFPIR
jgi:myo-inositol-1(or 4)-monophosphatase